MRGLLAATQGCGEREGYAWVAERESAIIAAIGLTGVTSSFGVQWSIPFLIVAPNARRSRVGRGLLRVALGEAEARGAVTVAAETLKTWPAADGFWRSVAALLAD